MNLLLVEDEIPLAQTLIQGLEENGYTVEHVADAELGAAVAREPIYDLILLDRMLPGRDGLELLSQLRRQGIVTPVLLLTARGELSDRIAGLDAGADDYLAKPFDFSELLARIRALIRRSKQLPFPELRFGDFRLDPKSQRVERGGREIALTPREYQLLEYLAFHPHQVLSRGELVEHLPDFSTDSNLLDVHISKLRHKLDQPFACALIQTVRGRGYRFSPAP